MASSSGTGREYPPELVHGAECDCGKSEPAASSGTGHDAAPEPTYEEWCAAYVPPAERVMDAAPAPGGWTPELRQLEREYDEANHAAHAAHDGFEEGLIRAASEAWERFSRAVKRQHA